MIILLILNDLKKTVSISIFFSLLLLGQTVFGQDRARNDYHITVKNTATPLNIDGVLDEAVWQQSNKATNFVQNFPTDSLPATSPTEMMAAYDGEFLYFAGICFTPGGEDYIIQSLRRDFDWPLNENLSIYIDPFNDKTNGFTFGITPAGIQREGLVTNGQDVSSDWDNKWYSKVKHYPDRWQFEMAIPFKTLRYNEDFREWNLIFLRLDLINNERSTWVPVPQAYRPSSFAFSGKMAFEGPLKKSGTNISLIPYISGGVERNHEEDDPRALTASTGFDAKIAISPSLNLDLTVNPDFSQVEVDRQVTNLSRFELFFPERRQFFLENSDLFSNNGFPRSRPFFSRRIGIAEDTTGNRVQVPITYGARLSGKIGNDWRVGLLNMQTPKTDRARPAGLDEIPGTYNLPGQNYSVAVVQRKVFSRSNISALLVNRQALGYSADDLTLSSTQFNRVFGLDYNLLSKDNRWEGNAYYHRSQSVEDNSDNFSSGLFLRYGVRKFRIGVFSSTIGRNYNAELGFVPRRNIIDYGTFGELFYYPKSKIINRHGPRARVFSVTDRNYSLTDRELNTGYNITFLNTSEFNIELQRTFQLLRDDFEPTGIEEEALREGTDYTWNTLSMAYNTDTRKTVSVEAYINYGGFYDGERFNLGGTANLRYQPYGSIGLTMDYNQISRPEGLTSVDFFLIGSRIDFTFTDKLFLTTFVQYNDQDDNVNLNTRFQWRFKPASDLFLVYTDNYFPKALKVKNRALVMKLSYWLNV